MFILFTVFAACSTSAPATATAAADNLGYEGKGQPADGTAADGYDVVACVDISDDVSCNGETVVVCCDADNCAVATSGEFFQACASTSDCQAAGEALGEYCTDGGGGGEDSGGGGGEETG